MQNPTECPQCGGEVEFLAFGKKDVIGQIVEVYWCWNCDLPIEGAPATQAQFDEQYQKAQAERAALKDSVLGAEFWDNWRSTFEKNLLEIQAQSVQPD